MSDLRHEIQNIIDRSICESEDTYLGFLKRLGEGSPTRDENPKSHFCLYFLPYDAAGKRVFIVHHKKSGLWLSPGGHIDKEETLLQTLNREIEEELGVPHHFPNIGSPFLLAITPIENNVQPCKAHYDIWYLMETDGKNFKVDPQEFHETRWLTIKDARKLVSDPANLKALDIVENLLDPKRVSALGF